MSRKRTPSHVELRKEPKQERSRHTYQAILQGAAKVLKKFGIHKFSTNKVAEESGVSIGSLYQYFPSKEAVLAALLEQSIEEEFHRLKEFLSTINPNLGAREVIKRLFALYYQMTDEDLAFRKIMVEAVCLVGKTPVAVKFHKSKAELLLSFMEEHYNCPSGRTDHNTTVFIVQYMLRATVFSSIDSDVENINKEHLFEELAETLMNFIKVPAEYRDVIS